jgi:hypothetical protein
MKPRSLTLLAGAVLVLGGLGYSAWRYVAARESHICKACTRTVHEHSQVLALVDGKRGAYCCPACALSEHLQSGRPVEVIELTDHLTGRKLEPAAAFVVRSSDINPCLQHQPAVTPDKQPLHAHFDRCSPSILAFVSGAAAREFSRQHGGQVLRFADLASEYRR